MLIDLLVVDNRIPNEVYTRWSKIQEFFMVFQIQINIEFFYYCMWPGKSQDYKLSFVRSKKTSISGVSIFTRLRNSTKTTKVIIPNKANLHFRVIKNLKNYKNSVIFGV